MAVNESYKEFIDDQLNELGDIIGKKMFGGVGYYKEGVIFAAIMYDVFMLKVNDSNRTDFVKHNIKPWSPPGREMKMPYYAVPVEILENKRELKKWCLKAWEGARLSGKK